MASFSAIRPGQGHRPSPSPASRPQSACGQRTTARAVATPSTVTEGSKLSPLPKAPAQSGNCATAPRCRSAPDRQSPTGPPAFPPARQGPGKAHHLGIAAGHQRCAGAVAQARADHGSGGDGDHVLQRPAQFSTLHVVGPVKPQRRGGQQFLQPSPSHQSWPASAPSATRARCRQQSLARSGSPPAPQVCGRRSGPRGPAGWQDQRPCSRRPAVAVRRLRIGIQHPPRLCIGTASSNALPPQISAISACGHAFGQVTPGSAGVQAGFAHRRTCAGSRAQSRTSRPPLARATAKGGAECPCPDDADHALAPFLPDPSMRGRPIIQRPARPGDEIPSGRRPARSRSIPAQAIIAALSVQSRRGGARKGTPGLGRNRLQPRAHHRRGSRPHPRPRPAPAAPSPASASARAVFSASTSATAA
jgi:hypothetical protein